MNGNDYFNVNIFNVGDSRNVSTGHTPVNVRPTTAKSSISRDASLTQNKWIT